MGQAKELVSIGILFSTEGPYASLGREGYHGALTAIAEINETSDYPFALVPEIRDPKGQTENYASMCRELVENGNSRFVVGCTTSWSRKEVIPVLEKTGGQLWYPCPYEGFETNEHVVYLGTCANQHIVPLLDYVLARHGPNPMLIGSNYIWGWEVNRIARELIEQSSGHVVGERFVPLGDVDIAHLIEEIRASRPDFVLNVLVGPSSLAFVRAYHELAKEDPSFSPARRPIVSCNWTEAEVRELGAAAIGHLTTAPYFQSLPSDDNANFLAKLARFAPAIRDVSAYFAQAYSAVHMIARGMAASGGSNPRSILEHAMDNLYRGPLGPLRIAENTQHAFLAPKIGMARAEGGFEIIDNPNILLAPDPYLARQKSEKAFFSSGKTGRAAPYIRVIK